MADEVSKNGVFIDTKTGKIVEKQPEEGIQIVPPGGTIDAVAQAQIDAVNNADSGAAQQQPVDLSATGPAATPSAKAK